MPLSKLNYAIEGVLLLLAGYHAWPNTVINIEQTTVSKMAAISDNDLFVHSDTFISMMHVYINECQWAN